MVFGFSLIQRARGLLTKGKNGTNNCFVTIALGKEKYQTSVKEKAESSVNWNEECELKIPDQGNRAELTLTCLHRNNLGIDEFLGQATLPLKDMDVYDRPRAKWCKLESKPGKEKKNKERGELEVRIAFVVKSGSLTDLSKKDKHKSSIGQLASSVGGSLLSIGQGEKRKSIKKLAGSLSSKLHIRSKKKQADGDDSGSFSGSFASIGTPNSSSGLGGVGGGSGRRRGQRAGEADPGVISEDEDEFVFDNLSHKSSGSSLNIQRSGLQPPSSNGNNNFTPRNPSPLLSNGGSIAKGKLNGGKPKLQETVDEDPIVAEMEQLELDFSVRARTLPPPSKPPRTQQTQQELELLEREQMELKPEGNAQMPVEPTPAQSAAPSQVDEWESKLYGGGKYLEIGSSDSLKRRSWETRVPLPATSEEPPPVPSSSSSSSSSDEEEDFETVEEEPPKAAAPPRPSDESSSKSESSSLFSPNVEPRNFDALNASFAKFEQRNSTAIFADEQLPPEPPTRPPPAEPQPLPSERPKPQPRATNLEQLKAETAALAMAEAAAEEEASRQRRAAEDERLEAELRLNEQRLREEEAALQQELELQQEEQRRREAKRREEDQRLLSFAKRSTSMEEQPSKPLSPRQAFGQKEEEEEEEQTTAVAAPVAIAVAAAMADVDPSIEHNLLTPEQSPKEFNNIGGGSGGGAGSGSGSGERWEKRLGKFKYGNKRDKQNDTDSNSPSPKSTERIIIGHEKSGSHADRRSEISAQLAKKYEGKSREELMLIANGMENEALLQRQRVKELEDYLDNLLLRVMETHPKILQNPYSRTTSAKSYKNYINMNDFLK
ncbi:rab11 family-interacting protein 1 isoform X2 [Drosophila mojavensis]|uniref:rab11 family-interacting protein 1 isoform X2 n=1 Tax=Drosophila mojavensis TaxID=7230 RepID=UPI001CD18A46|nr:rab11 family-interacting protein 1 isoform X2 [Drosophila mojavensis]